MEEMAPVSVQVEQKVCEEDAEAPACLHDRFCEFWGDHADGPVLGTGMSRGEWFEMYDNDLFEWTNRVWNYNRAYASALETELPGGLNACEISHRQRVALDLVFLLSIMFRRNLPFLPTAI